MNLWSRIWGWLVAPNKKRQGKGHPDLYPIDVLGLTIDLQLESKAKELGEAGLPASDAILLSGPETLIVQRIEKARQDYVDWAVIRLGVISNDMAKFNVANDVNRATHLDHEFDRETNALLTERGSLLKELADKARVTKGELESFKNRNGLVREAQYRSPSGTFLSYAVLAVMVLLEGGLNATFFAEGIDTGLMGGFIYASLLALLNVGIAFLCGKFIIKFTFHKSWQLRLLGVLLDFLVFFFIVLMALVIAHFRDSLGLGVADPAIHALDTLMATPFVLRDLFSWMLALASFIFGIAALLDGFFTDDKYPGYGRSTRRAKFAQEEYEEELSGLREELNELKEEKLVFLDEILSKVQGSIAAFDSLILDKVATKSRLETAFRDADHSLMALLSTFRTFNELYRNGVQRPSYFDTHPDLEELTIPDVDVDADNKAAEMQRQLVNELISRAQLLRGSIQASFNQQYDRLQPLDQQLSGFGGK